MTTKTSKQIKALVKKLKALRPKIRPYSMFGGDNIAQLDAMVDVLENELDNDEIFDKYDRDEFAEETLEAALEAKQWMDGDSDEDLADGWPMK